MPEKCSHKTETIRFRVATKDRAVMEAAAKEAGLTLSDWMRSRLLLAAVKRTKDVMSPEPEKIVTLTNDGKLGQRLRPDPDRLAAFQKAAGMGGVRSRG